MKLMTAVQAAALVADGATVACAGFVGAGHAEAVTAALERRFLATAAPRDLTLVYSAGQGDRATRGVNHFGNPGMTRRIIGGHWRSAPRLSKLALDEQCEAFNLPQGVITHLYRAIAGGQPGVLTRIGLNTFVDPRSALDERFHGGAVNRRARDAVADGRAAPVEAVKFRGADLLFYPRFRIDVALIRATAADERGNLSTHEEAFHHELLALAQAARNSGGLVIAQVRRIVPRHETLTAIHVPGILVDVIVVVDDPAEHPMTFSEQYNPAYHTPWQGAVDCADVRKPLGKPPGSGFTVLAPARLTAREIIQRRALLELTMRGPRVVNLGVGMPAGIGALAADAGIGGFTLTVEAGPVGGTPADGLSFGASAYPEAVIDQLAQFDFYDGGGIDLAILGMAELDVAGNVNVSKFGEHGQTIIAGVGGFVNITQSARTLVFTGTLTAGGLEVEARAGGLRIVREGRLRKIVPAVAHLTFNAAHARHSGIPVRYITERAVFEVRDGTLTLIEVVPGIDVRRDVLEQCGDGIAVSPMLERMNERLFNSADMGLFQ